MLTDRNLAIAQAGRASLALQRALHQLPQGGLERQAIAAGEIDAVINHAEANIIVFPVALRALREAAKRVSAADRKEALEMPERNGVLAALARTDYRLLLPGLERVSVDGGEVLHEAGAPIRHVYFPVDCVVCLLTVIDHQRTVETGLVGHEGMVGIALALGVDRSPVRAVVEVAGTAMRMSAARFNDELRRGLQLQRQLHRCAQVEVNRARQTAACIASHRLEKRLACWLLMVGDRARSPDMILTQKHLAAVMNVRRVSVTLAFGVLRTKGLISYSRGKLCVLDRKGLMAASCACYQPIEVSDVA